MAGEEELKAGRRASSKFHMSMEGAAKFALGGR